MREPQGSFRCSGKRRSLAKTSRPKVDCVCLLSDSRNLRLSARSADKIWGFLNRFKTGKLPGGTPSITPARMLPGMCRLTPVAFCDIVLSRECFHTNQRGITGSSEAERGDFSPFSAAADRALGAPGADAGTGPFFSCASSIEAPGWPRGFECGSFRHW